ncbi:putative DHHC zinc finger domain-containing protein [Neospora caninum Liverpool]|uniref:DHHC zinc finger domain-containing protein,putative n=1 Tax=Neospora caninum (strain Liverpool) TaxID=572307 RepID=F0V787_NEOCL|nr:putative DHHC zinc finger domain-containing protein [Neospora caninum Liverpool]CBZ49578.1 putative DHHC zinc finger domain-containing protein [Neospora caninum Liverpool]CEL64158.1 TPA: DHHC zinc finger domain-containing protein,putative [Neospora caninum Liverpool]|eukprot:XP_003879613.1 putative DHHC zinc finger domain-containing protein [Neospora caninum Liverpool]
MAETERGYTMDLPEEPQVQVATDRLADPSLHHLVGESKLNPEDKHDHEGDSKEGEAHLDKKKIPMPGAVRLIGDQTLDAEFQQKVAEREQRRASQMSAC